MKMAAATSSSSSSSSKTDIRNSDQKEEEATKDENDVFEEEEDDSSIILSPSHFYNETGGGDAAAAAAVAGFPSPLTSISAASSDSDDDDIFRGGINNGDNDDDDDNGQKRGGGSTVTVATTTAAAVAVAGMEKGNDGGRITNEHLLHPSSYLADMIKQSNDYDDEYNIPSNDDDNMQPQQQQLQGGGGTHFSLPRNNNNNGAAAAAAPVRSGDRQAHQRAMRSPFGQKQQYYNGRGGGSSSSRQHQHHHHHHRIFPPRTPAKETKNLLHFQALGIYAIVGLFYTLTTTLILMGRISWLPMIDKMFVLYIVVFLSGFTLISMCLGAMVIYFGLPVMYTRKIMHFFSFFQPFILFYIIPFEKMSTTYILTFQISFIAYIPLIEPIRSSQTILGRAANIAFAAFDREDDRPFTLLWAVTQSLMTFVVLTPLGILLAKAFGAPMFIAIPILSVSVGDGMAEIIGRLFGSHKYTSTALFTEKEYTRSIEGSLCVYCTTLLVSIIIPLFVQPGMWDWRQILLCAIVLPMITTYTEAVAPHTWDNAIILFVSGFFIIVVFLLGIAL